LEKQMKVMSKKGVGLVYTGKKHIFPKDGIEFISEATVTGDLSDKIFEKNFIGSTSCVLVKKNLLIQAGLFDENLPSLQDYDLWIRICQLTQVGIVNEPLLIYVNKDDNNQVSANITKNILAFDMLTAKYDRFLSDKKNLKASLEKYIIETILKIAQRNSNKNVLIE